MSKNSFLFKFNDWWDANAFMTMGKSIWQGVVPYRDLFEQKGPYLYFIYAIAAIISNKTFIGVYFLEIISMFINLIFVRKIIKLFYKDEKYSFLGILIYCFSAFFVFTFGHGGSAEEFTLPLMFITMFYYNRYLKDKKEINIDKKVLLINGIIAGVVFWIKYSLLGFWFIFAATMCLIPLFKKDIKTSLINA
ncbi:MAG: glycosyltransferase family 39 protein, partial [Bacilli bacterium]|nr:glycosyltransferase family 39 protein [Bacilli bacterium]